MLKELSDNLLPPQPTGASDAKVHSRLLSSKILAVEIAAVVQDLRNFLKPKPDPSDETVEQDPVQSKKQKKGSEAKDKSTRVVTLAKQKGEDGENQTFPGTGEEEDGWESGTVGDDDEEQDDGWESVSLAGDDDGPDQGSDSDISNEDLQIASKPPKKSAIPPKAAPKKVPPKATGMQSTFLPSLAVGFIPGGSDDEMSENEAKAGDIDLKKNRRGQRARRA